MIHWRDDFAFTVADGARLLIEEADDAEPLRHFSQGKRGAGADRKVHVAKRSAAFADALVKVRMKILDLAETCGVAVFLHIQLVGE